MSDFAQRAAERGVRDILSLVFSTPTANLEEEVCFHPEDKKDYDNAVAILLAIISEEAEKDRAGRVERLREIKCLLNDDSVSCIPFYAALEKLDALIAEKEKNGNK